VTGPSQLGDAIAAALADGGPSMVEVVADVDLG
jgi:hypothetical protein